MISRGQQEKIQRGSPGFPLDYHYVDRLHPRYEMPYHWHNECEIIFVVSGNFQLLNDTQEVNLSRNDCAFIPSGALHGGVPEDCVYECVVFDLNMLLRGDDRSKKQIWDIIQRNVDVHTFFHAEDLVVSSVIRPMFEGLRERGLSVPLVIVGYLYLFFGLVYELGCYKLSEPDKKHISGSRMAQLKTVFELIETEYASPLTLTDLAKSVHMSPKYFCGFFKETTHRTPMNYLTFFRIEKACYLLAASEMNVTEIAFAVGFSDVNYFIRCFKKYKGMPPTAYKKKLSEPS